MDLVSQKHANGIGVPTKDARNGSIIADLGKSELALKPYL